MSQTPAEDPPGLQLPIWVLVLAAGVAAYSMVAGWLAAWPLDLSLRDDAYYYFAWARSMAAGEGPCVTPGVPTSGVHVGWGMILAAAAQLLGPAALPSAGVVLGFCCHLATGWLICGAVGTKNRASLLAGLVYVGSPFLVSEVLNGQETGLACFCLALLWRFGRGGVVAFVLTSILAVCARSDLIFFVCFLALLERRTLVPRLIALGLVLSCYGVWNILLAGSWLQDSADPIPWLMVEELAHGGGSRWDRVLEGLRELGLGTKFRLSSTVMAAAWLLVAWLGWRRGDRSFLLLLLAGLALVCFHVLWRDYPRNYYFAPLGVMGGFALVRLARLAPRTGLVFLLLGMLWNGWNFQYPPRHLGWQREMTMAGMFLGEVVPGGEAVGCFNAGLVTWNHGGRVVNLDGVVNAPAFEALERGDLLGYLNDQGVHYLVDNPIQFARQGLHSNGRHFGPEFDPAADLTEAVRFLWPEDPGERDREGIGRFSLYRLRGGGQPPIPLDETRDLGPAPGGGRFIAWPGRAGQGLRIGERTVLVAEADLVYVLQLPWAGDGPLRLYSGDGIVPVLEIARH